MSRKSNRAGIIFVTLITSCLLLTSFGFAETKYDLGGKKAFQFGITNNFNLKDFQGGTVSFKKHYSNSKAWRLGLDLELEINDLESNQFSNDTARLTRDSDENSRRFVMRIQRLFYRNSISRVKPFLGIGPLFGFSRQRLETITEYPYSSRIDERIYTTDSWSVGITGLVGIEWFASGNISLTAEYSSELAYGYRKYKREDKHFYPDQIRSTVSDDKTKSLDFHPVGVRFGLSVYF